VRRTEGEPPALTGFEFVRPLGSGGFSDVFLYEQQLPRRQVAVKVLVTDEGTATNTEAFIAEANVMARLSTHPYIVSIHGAGVADDGRPYFIMEYYGGASLAQQYKERPLPVAEVLRVGVRLASAVATAHAAGILHRDIKPANVLTNEYGRPGLTDFGISSRLEEEAVLQTVTRLRAGDTAGTGGTGGQSVGLSVPWSPPEMFSDDPSPDVRSDIFSLAATLYTLLAGRSPFEVPGGPNQSADLMSRIERGAVVPLDRDDVPASLATVLHQGMAIDRARRPATALEFARALQRIELELAYAATPIEIPGVEVPRTTTRLETVDAEQTMLREARTGMVPQPPHPPPPPPPSPGAGADAQTTVLAPRPVEPISPRTGRGVPVVAGILIGAAAILVAAVLIVVVVLIRPPTTQSADQGGAVTPDAGPSTSPEPVPAVEAEPRPTTETLPRLPIQRVTIGVPDYADRSALAGVQVFADAIAKTSTEQLVLNCWTFAPDTVRDRYGTDQARGAILEAFTHEGEIGQTGAFWAGDLVTVSFINEELGSRYPCPWVTINGEPQRYDRIDAEWLVARLAGRLTGHLVGHDDYETKYFLECSADDPLMPWSLDGASAPPVTVDRAPVDAATLALAGKRLAVEEIAGDAGGDLRYWRLTAVGTTGPSLIVQTWWIRACVGAAG
jgi:serine/threonine protein kinase